MWASITDSGVRSSCEASAVNSSWRRLAWSIGAGDAPADRDGSDEDDQEQHRRDQQLGQDQRRLGLGDAVEVLGDDDVVARRPIAPAIRMSIAVDRRRLRVGHGSVLSRQVRIGRRGEDGAIRLDGPGQEGQSAGAVRIGRREVATSATAAIAAAATGKRLADRSVEGSGELGVDLGGEVAVNDCHDRHGHDQVDDGHDPGGRQGDPDRLAPDLLRTDGGHASSSR